MSETEGDITIDDMINLEFSVPQVYRDHSVWLMSNDAFRRLRRVKKFCQSKQIPEDILIAATEEVIGSLNAIDSKITVVRVENGNTLVFCLTNGEQIVKRWQDRSRRESWTPEMKNAARQKELERRSHHAKS